MTAEEESSQDEFCATNQKESSEEMLENQNENDGVKKKI